MTNTNSVSDLRSAQLDFINYELQTIGLSPVLSFPALGFIHEATNTYLQANIVPTYGMKRQPPGSIAYVFKVICTQEHLLGPSEIGALVDSFFDYADMRYLDAFEGDNTQSFARDFQVVIEKLHPTDREDREEKHSFMITAATVVNRELYQLGVEGLRLQLNGVEQQLEHANFLLN